MGEISSSRPKELPRTERIFFDDGKTRKVTFLTKLLVCASPVSLEVSFNSKTNVHLSTLIDSIAEDNEACSTPPAWGQSCAASVR